MTELIGLVGELGTAGGIAVVAWLFHDDFPRTSRMCLVFAIVLMGVLALSEAWHQMTATEFELVIEPSHDQPAGKWGGVYEEGASVGRISAELVKDGEETIESVNIPSIEVASRILDLELDPDRSDRLIASLNGNRQGWIYIPKLSDDVRERIFSGSVRPHAVAFSNEVNYLGDRLEVSPYSAVRREFDSLEITVKEWIYHPVAGVAIDLHENGELITEGLVTQEDALPISTPTTKATVALVGIDLTGEAPNRASFVMLKYL